ncbi:hypothetical protein M406DRAFT_342752 [Cryphonectria parasitica EP155]|uniref:GCS light chain n=1 Tax=Cryphonectria parasitica (strain ATCC 38755 / EP155) TaxID=660469 RepID=A0A9P4XT99_CRYP1|nr:uncharacterized protein M406DRAFT_342752 [Cryphonectria parasitica EP155]KAF3760516.1 hypothetical protein M406DRAFT_342752 [Cryphonectria parasitica EP155]
MPSPSQGRFKWPVDFLQTLVDCILPRRQKQRQRQSQDKQQSPPTSSEDSANMVKRLILSTGHLVLLRSNISVGGGSSLIRKPGAFRSNLELTNSLRNNFLAAKQEYDSSSQGSKNSTPNGHSNGNGNTNGAPNGISSPLAQWTSLEGNGDLYVPRIDWDATPGLQEDAAAYDITVKIFFLPTSTLSQRAAYTREALSLVMKELRVSAVSLLIVSFPGMSFEGDCEWEADKHNATQGDDEGELATWESAIEPLYHEGLVGRLGIAEFGSEKLSRFLEGVSVKPGVDQINIKNCCDVPPPLVSLAKEKNIELFVHSDCTDILPKGTLRELLGQGPKGAGVLADPADGVEREDKEEEEGLRGDLTPQWVVKYTAVVRDRGVIESKGYFAGAALTEE